MKDAMNAGGGRPGVPDAVVRRFDPSMYAVTIVVLMVVTALFVLTQLYLSIPLLTHVGQEFPGATPKTITFALVTGFSLAYASGFLIWGPISDQYGRRPVMLGGLLALVLATFACAFASSLFWLACLRAIQGLSASSFAPVALAYLTEAMPVRLRATAIGAMSTAFLVAGIFGQVLAAWVAMHWGWSWVFLVTGASLTALIPLVVVMVGEPVRAAVQGHLGHRFVVMCQIAVRPAVALLSCAHFVLLLSFVAMYTALGPHLSVLGLDPGAVILLRLVGLPAMFVALLSGPWTARIGMPKVASIAYLLSATGLALEAALSHSLLGVALGSLLFVAGVALAMPVMIRLYGELALPNRAAGMALNGFVLFVGASVGPLIAERAPGFAVLLLGLALVLVLAALCVAGSAWVAHRGATSKSRHKPA